MTDAPAPKSAPPTHILNPETGVMVDVRNITSTSVSTPPYSFFLGQPSGRAAVGLSTPAPEQTVTQIVKPNVQAPIPRLISRQKQAQADIGPGMIAVLKSGISASTIEYLASQGLAPSDVSTKAIGEYISIAKQYQSKQPSFQPVENPLEYFVGEKKVGSVSGGGFTFSGGGQKVLEENFPFSSRVFEQLPSKEQASFIGSGELSRLEVVHGATINTMNYPVVASMLSASDFKAPITPQEAVSRANQASGFKITPQEAVTEANKAAGITWKQTEGEKLLSETGMMRPIYEELSKVSQEGIGIDAAAKSFMRSVSTKEARASVKATPLLGDLAQGAVNAPGYAEGFFIKAPAALLPAMYVGVKNPGLAWEVGAAATGKTIEQAKTPQFWTEVAGASLVMGGIIKTSGTPKVEVYSAERFGLGTGEAAKVEWSPAKSEGWANLGEAGTMKAIRTPAGPEIPVGKNYWVSAGWQRGTSAKILGGTEITTGGGATLEVGGYLGKPNIPETGLFALEPTKSPMGTAVGSKLMEQYGTRLSNLKGPELTAYNKLVKDYAKGAEPAERGFITEYVKTTGKTIFTEGKDLSLLSNKALVRAGPKVIEEPKITFANVEKLQEPFAVTRTTPGERILDFMTEKKSTSGFGSTAQRIQMGEDMTRGFPGDIDQLAKPEAGSLLRPNTAGDLAKEQANILKPSFKPGEIEAETTTTITPKQGWGRGLALRWNEFKTEFTGLVNRGEQGHVLDIHDKGSSSVVPGNPDYVGFGVRPEDTFNYKGLDMQRLSEQSIAKGESAFRPNKLGALPEARRFKDIYDVVDIAKTASKRSGNKVLSSKAVAFESKLPQEMLDYFKVKGKDTVAERAENAAQFGRSQKYVNRLPSIPKASALAVVGSFKASASRGVSIPSFSIPSSFGPSEPSYSISVKPSSPSRSSLSSKSSGISYPSSFPSPYSPSGYSSPSSSSRSSPSSSRSSSSRSSLSSVSSLPSPYSPYSPSSSKISSVSIKVPSSFGSLASDLSKFKRKKGIKFPKFKEKRGRSILQPHLTYIEKTRLELRKQEPYRITVPSTPKTRAAFIKSGLGAFGYSGLLRRKKKKGGKKR